MFKFPNQPRNVILNHFFLKTNSKPQNPLFLQTTSPQFDPIPIQPTQNPVHHTQTHSQKSHFKSSFANLSKHFIALLSPEGMYKEPELVKPKKIEHEKPIITQKLIKESTGELTRLLENAVMFSCKSWSTSQKKKYFVKNKEIEMKLVRIYTYSCFLTILKIFAGSSTIA